MKKVLIASLILTISSAALAEGVPISGHVKTRCLITTDTNGVYGNPLPSKLSTSYAEGGVVPVVRYDVTLADSYLAKITTPSAFSESPALLDTVTWTGVTSVTKTTDAAMSAYEVDKILYDNTTQFDLTIAGSTWFSSESTAVYGGTKSFPGGIYSAIIVAECIAK